MRLLWAIDSWVTGASLGYSVHRAKLKEALLALGVDVTTDRGEPFDLAVHVMRPDYFKPIPGVKNLLFTTTEFSEPTNWGETVAEATALVVPCEYSRSVCARHYSGPVHVCPEGIDPEHFSFYQRTAPGPTEPFRFLFIGNDATGTKEKSANATRKGLDIVLSSWTSWFQTGRMPANAQLYVKTTNLPGPELQYSEAFSLEWTTGQRIPRGFKPASAPSLPGIVFDTRTLSLSDLVGLYNSSHCFVYPSRGEGWGLGLTDAMATGCPSIWTDFSAMLDYGDESIGYPIPAAEFEVRRISHSNYKPGGVELPLLGAEVKADASVFGRQWYIFHHYDEALRRGRAASERMHSRYTWRHAAEKFIEICEEVLS